MADRTVTYRFEGKVDGLQASLTQASTSVQDFGSKLTALDKQGAKMRAGLDTIASAAGKVGLASAAGLGAVVAVAANFEQSMSNVAATGDDARNSLDQLREAAVEAGAATAFSATEAAAGIENLLKAGVSADDVLSGGLAGALDLAAAGELEVADAAEIAATALTQFGLAGADIPHVADLLAAGAGKAQGDVSDLSQALKQSGLVASQMGISLEETVGTLSAFASAGLLGSDAGTSFRTMLLRLANPTKESKDLMEGLGIAAYDANGEFVGMASIAGQLQTAFEGKTQAERDSAMATLFGSDAIRAASILYSQGTEGVNAWTNQVNDAGYAAETAATRMDNLKGDFEEFTGALETAMIGAGEGAQGPLRKLVQTGTDLVNVFNDLPGPAKNAASGMLAITAILGGGLWFGSKVLGSVLDMKGALSDLGVQAPRTASALGKMAKLGPPLLIAAGAVAAIADNMNRVNPSDLERSLEALSRGQMTDSVKQVVTDLGNLESSLNAVDLGEVVTLFGVLGDTSLDRAAQNVEMFDQALASMVETGERSQATALYHEIIAEAGLSAGQAAEQFDAYTLALENSIGSASATADATSGAGDAASVAADQTAQYEEALSGVRDAAYDTTETFLGLGDSLSDSKVSLGDWIEEMVDGARSLRDFRVNAEQAAKNGLDDGLIASLEAAGKDGALRMKQLADASETEIGRANAAWRTQQRQAEKYADQVQNRVLPSQEKFNAELDETSKKTPKPNLNPAEQAIVDLFGNAVQLNREIDETDRKNAKPNVDASDIASAMSKAHSLANALDRLATDRRAVINIDTYERTFRMGGNKALPNSEGGTIPRMDVGGTVQGQRQPYGDKVFAFLAPGEEVISNRFGQADRHRSLLKAINANSFAAGGTAGGGGASGIRGPISDPVWRDFYASMRGSGSALKDLRRAVKESEAAVDRERSKRDDLRSRMDSLGSSVAGKYDGGLFGAGLNLPDWLSQEQRNLINSTMTNNVLTQDIASLKAQIAAQKQLGKKGLKGDALAALLEGADLATIQAYAGMGKQELKQYASLYEQRASLQSQAGRSAGEVAYGKDMRESRKELREANEIHRRNEKRLDRIEAAIKKSAKDTGKEVANGIKRPVQNSQRGLKG